MVGQLMVMYQLVNPITWHLSKTIMVISITTHMMEIIRIMIPLMMLLLGLDQLIAQGTSLAVTLPPIGILAAYNYYQSGNLKIN